MDRQTDGRTNLLYQYRASVRLTRDKNGPMSRYARFLSPARGRRRHHRLHRRKEK